MRHDERTYDSYPERHSAERLAYPDADVMSSDALLTVQDVELGYGPAEWLDMLEDEDDIRYRAEKAVFIAEMRAAMKEDA